MEEVSDREEGSREADMKQYAQDVIEAQAMDYAAVQPESQEEAQ